VIRDAVVVGAGWAGLTAANELADAGHDVLVVEKSRGPGGRSATRRADGARFDHGAQYFTARTAAFGRRLQQWRDDGLAQPWKPRLAVLGGHAGHGHPGDTRRFVGVPGMNAICTHMAAERECRYRATVEQLAFEGGLWRVRLGDDETVEARRLVVTAPPAQAAALLGSADPLHDDLAGVEFDPCITAMLSFSDSLDPGFDAAFVNDDGPLSWIACNSSKPGRDGRDWVLHATAEWSRKHLDEPFDRLADALVDAFADGIDGGIDGGLPETIVRTAHRWRYSQAADPRNDGAIVDAERRLAVAGDWLAGSRIEGAWSSGRKAGQALAET
jgi:hypothetical protein